MSKLFMVTVHTQSGRVEKRKARAKNKHGAEHLVCKSMGIQTPGAATAVEVK